MHLRQLTSFFCEFPERALSRCAPKQCLKITRRMNETAVHKDTVGNIGGTTAKTEKSLRTGNYTQLL